MPPAVLIVGAGPTGLMLALWLRRFNVPFRIIDAHEAPGEASRALVVQARTLEFYRQLGIADEAIRRGIPIRALHIDESNSERGRIDVGDIGTGVSPYPFMLSLPQDEHEQFLVETLAALGVQVERNTELLQLTQNDDSLTARIAAKGTEETTEFAYVCGADGSHSRVRECLKVEFIGGTYQQRFFVADVMTERAPPDMDLHMALSRDGFCLRMPVRSSGAQRLIGIVPAELADTEVITFDSVQSAVEPLVGMKVTSVNWFSTYHVHHRVAERFRIGRAFLLGDAAHVHSPAGGQGMNTGLGDAVNLAWKLAAVIGGADETLLETYETERHAFANLLVNTTDRAFQMVVNPSKFGEIFRTWLLPHLVPFIFGLSTIKRATFNTVSQTRIDYRDSALSAGAVHDLHGGDRLPWIPYGDTDNFAPLANLEWQIHVYGKTSKGLKQWTIDRAIRRYEFPANDATAHASITPGSAYLVRPDGYIAVASETQDPAEFEKKLTRFGLHS